MKRPDTLGSAGVLEAAAIRASRHARWEAAELLSRKQVPNAADLLRARSAELATSASGRDQLMSLALEAAAADVAEGRTPLADGAMFFFAQPPDGRVKLHSQQGVFAKFNAASSLSGEVVARLEAEHRGTLGAAPTAVGELSVRLMEDAKLHKQLWDHPRIPADAETRLLLLCSVPRLVDRVRALDPMRMRALRALAKWPHARLGGAR